MGAAARLDYPSTRMAALKKPVCETLNLSDGSTLKFYKDPSMGSSEWADMKSYYEANPEEARMAEAQAKDAKTMRDAAIAETLQEYYSSLLGMGDDVMKTKMDALERSPEFGNMIGEFKKGGSPQGYYYNEPLMIKMNRAMGGLPEDVKEKLASIQTSPCTIWEACKMGKTKVLEDFLASPGDWNIDDTDANGISCLGYAVGANRPAVVKVLLEKKASPTAVDTSGNSALHYAAAYGRTEMVKYLAGTCKVDGTNASGQTPLALATKNKMTEAADALKAKGAKA